MSKNVLPDAIQQMQAGNLDKAKATAEAYIENHPNNPEGLTILAMILLKKKDLGSAEATICKATLLDPENASYQCNLALILTERNKEQEAIEAYQRALHINPQIAEAFLNLAILQRKQGKLEEAIKSCSQATAIRPGFVQAHNALGNILRDSGDAESAITEYQHAIHAQPDNFLSYLNLAGILSGLDRNDEAYSAYKRALQLNPESADVYRGIAQCLKTLGKTGDAIVYARQATLRSGNNSLSDWQAFASCCRGADLDQVDIPLLKDIEQCLLIDNIDHLRLTGCTLALIKRTPEYTELLSNKPAEFPRIFQKEISQTGCPKLFSQRALPLLLTRVVMADVEFERILIAIRLAYLEATLSGTICDVNNALPGIVSLGRQCFLNEYIYSESPAEHEKTSKLAASLKNQADFTTPGFQLKLAVLAMYRPLFTVLPGKLIEELLDSPLQEPLSSLIRIQVGEPREELEIRKHIPNLTPISDLTSSKVKSQYEDNPYPRWQSSIFREPGSVPSFINIVVPNIPKHISGFPSKPRVLIAGCGSGLHAIGAARRFKDSRILAVDLSLTSLAYGIRKAREFGITNIEFAQADILELHSLETRFDVVESAGVLHHMDDPVAGWKILVDLLEPHGFMQIGLYSEIARRCVVEARELITRRAYQPTLDGIRAFREDILKQPDNAQVRQVINFRDFFSTSACRDLVFHVQERRLNLIQIKHILDQLDLEFLGFHQNNSSVTTQFKSMFPEDKNMASLELWDKFEHENPFTFTAMYQMWLRKCA